MREGEADNKRDKADVSRLARSRHISCVRHVLADVVWGELGKTGSLGELARGKRRAKLTPASRCCRAPASSELAGVARKTSHEKSRLTCLPSFESLREVSRPCWECGRFEAADARSFDGRTTRLRKAKRKPGAVAVAAAAMTRPLAQSSRTAMSRPNLPSLAYQAKKRNRRRRRTFSLRIATGSREAARTSCLTQLTARH